MDVEHQVLQVGVDACLGVDRGLFVGQQVVELDDSDGDRLVLLSLVQTHFEQGVFNNLVGNFSGEVTSLCHIPPIIAVERCIGVVA